MKGYSCRMSSEGVLLPDKCVTGVRDALGSGGVLLSDECVTGVRDELGSGGVLLPDEFVMCSAGRNGQ